MFSVQCSYEIYLIVKSPFQGIVIISFRIGSDIALYDFKWVRIIPFFKFNNQINQHKKDLSSNSLLLVPCYRKNDNNNRRSVYICVILFIFVYTAVYEISQFDFLVPWCSRFGYCCYFRFKNWNFFTAYILLFSLVFTVSLLIIINQHLLLLLLSHSFCFFPGVALVCK